jgi:hypothetical protein
MLSLATLREGAGEKGAHKKECKRGYNNRSKEEEKKRLSKMQP